MQLSWSDPRLSVASDSRRTARYRLLQSWYREQVLKARYGDYHVAGGLRPVASLLDVQEVIHRPGLNFLTDRAAQYARERAGLVVASGGVVDHGRLVRNMLASTPLAFSLVGELRSGLDRGLEAVRAFLDPHAVGVDLVECLWRPAVDVLGDNACFDAAVITERADGSRHLIGIDVRYVEPFNRTIYNSDAYRQMHEQSGWFRPATTRSLLGPSTNQLWRLSLLAASCVSTRVCGISSASVAVFGLAEDPGTATAIVGMSAALREPERHLRFVSLESLVAGFREGIGPGPEWAERFATRYLNPPPMTAELPEYAGGAELY
jgi:hypothetical protein